MANTRKLPRPARKAKKRVLRKAFKKFIGKIGRDTKREYYKEPKGGLKGFVLAKARAAKKEAAAPAAEAPKPAEG